MSTKELNKQQKKFLRSPSKLSSGEKNRRFKGTVGTMFHLAACTGQSGPVRKSVCLNVH